MANTCCPKGYYYIDSPGTFLDVTGLVVSISNYNPAIFVGQCVNIVNSTYAILPSPAVDPIPCLCCPSGYNYQSFSGLCVNAVSTAIAPIPCITCNCVTPPLPECPSCGTSGLGINFSFDFFSKACTTCVAEDLSLTKDKNLNSFLPVQFISPLINFKLKP